MLNHRVVDIKRLFDSYEAELHLVDERLREFFQSDAFVIPLVGRYLLESGGKRVRPLYLLSSARLSGYRGQEHITLAGIVELIHMASLLHDDVVDGAELRRGRAPAHALWGNQVVILVGDFLYSNALKRAVSFREQKIMEALSDATTKMTEGELLQLQKSGDIAITEDDYMKIINAKTGILISAACRVGAILGGRSPEEEDALARFGLKAGTAFQLADDILDYMADEGELGKRLGKDLEEGKVTLPLIYLLRVASQAERQEIRGLIEGSLSPEGLRRIVGLCRRYDVFEEAVRRASSLVEEARALLSVFPPSAARDEMLELAEFSLMRQN